MGRVLRMRKAAAENVLAQNTEIHDSAFALMRLELAPCSAQIKAELDGRRFRRILLATAHRSARGRRRLDGLGRDLTRRFGCGLNNRLDINGRNGRRSLDGRLERRNFELRHLLMKKKTTAAQDLFPLEFEDRAGHCVCNCLKALGHCRRVRSLLERHQDIRMRDAKSDGMHRTRHRAEALGRREQTGFAQSLGRRLGRTEKDARRCDAFGKRTHLRREADGMHAVVEDSGHDDRVKGRKDASRDNGGRAQRRLEKAQHRLRGTEATEDRCQLRPLLGFGPVERHRKAVLHGVHLPDELRHTREARGPKGTETLGNVLIRSHEMCRGLLERVPCGFALGKIGGIERLLEGAVGDKDQGLRARRGRRCLDRFVVRLVLESREFRGFGTEEFVLVVGELGRVDGNALHLEGCGVRRAEPRIQCERALTLTNAHIQDIQCMRLSPMGTRNRVSDARRKQS